MLMVEHPKRSAAWEGIARARDKESHFMFTESKSMMSV